VNRMKYDRNGCFRSRLEIDGKAIGLGWIIIIQNELLTMKAYFLPESLQRK
jgi:hypothetical protein